MYPTGPPPPLCRSNPGRGGALQAYETCELTGLRVRIARRSSWALIPIDMRVASFEISIGNPRCTGRSLVCLMNWGRENFRSFEFSVGDTLRVYNYMTIGHREHGRLDRAQATQVAAAEGQAWYQDNASAITEMLGGYDVRVTFWEEWKQRPGFESR